MSCVLRAWGKTFDVEAYFKNSKLKPSRVWKKGQTIEHGAKRGKKYQMSGFNCKVSNGDFNDLQTQIRDAIQFLKLFKSDLKRLTSASGLEAAGLDFGIINRALSVKGSAVQSDVFPAELVRLAGAVDLDIAITLYPGSQKTSKSKR
jgi:hypothetical protein